MATPAVAQGQAAQRPNILFMLADNLGYGELGPYGGGATRGAPTPRIDKFASEGLRLTNMNMEALGAGRHSHLRADRLQAVKWRNYKVHFYRQETMVSPPERLSIPLLFNLYTNPQEVEDKRTLDSWIVGPVLKMVAEFEESVKKYPLIPMGTPDPYRPPAVGR